MENQVLLSPIKRFFQMLRLDKKSIFYIYVYAVLAGFITLSLPLGIQAIIGLIAGGNMSASLILLVGIVTLGTALSGILKIMQISLTENIQRKIFARSALDFSYRIPKLNMENLATSYPPELINRFFDTLTIQKGLPKILIDVSTAVLQIAFGLILIAFYHSFFAFFGLILLGLLFAIFWFTAGPGIKTSLMESKYKYKVAHWLEDMARAITPFKYFKAPLGLKKTDDLVCSYLTSRQKHFRILLVQYGNLIGLKTILTGSLLMLGSYLVIQNQINIGQFVAAEIVIILVIGSVEKLIMGMENIYDVLTALEKMGFVTDLPLESDNGVDFNQVDTSRGITVGINNLSYQFEDAERPTLNGIDLQIPSGKKVAISGYNGSGKSTLLQLLMAQFSNFKGSILYNGMPQRNLKLNTLREHIGYFNQGDAIFQGTIMDNITLGREGVTFEDVVWACAQVNLCKYIEQLPFGYDTMIISEGRNIPGHIKTKIKLARAIVHRPQLLVLESDFQDIEREDYERIITFLTSKMNTWTVVISSNDLFTASHCDEVVILDKGKIVAQGSFAGIQEDANFVPIFISGKKHLSNDVTLSLNGNS